VLAGVQPFIARSLGGWTASSALLRAARTILAAFLLYVPLSQGDERPLIAIIVDDLGYHPVLDRRVISLPGAVTCAFLPDAPHASRLAGLADTLGKEVMLHMPMEALAGSEGIDGVLSMEMSRDRFVELLRTGLSALPQARGVNNHMGSLLTQSPLRMQWLMDELRQRKDFYFVDSYTSVRSIAWQVAAANRLPNARRDVFLDTSRDPQAIAFQFRRLLRLARERGSAIAIAHPYPETIEFLEQRLPELGAEGVTLVSVSRLIHSREARDPGAVIAGTKEPEF
jgi:polysaccharide deacetylase 2 family uncharacterized protein YibQ